MDSSGTASVRGLPRVGVGEVLPRSPLAPPERHDRAAVEGRSGSEAVSNVAAVRNRVEAQ